MSTILLSVGSIKELLGKIEKTTDIHLKRLYGALENIERVNVNIINIEIKINKNKYSLSNNSICNLFLIYMNYLKSLSLNKIFNEEYLFFSRIIPIISHFPCSNDIEKSLSYSFLFISSLHRELVLKDIPIDKKLLLFELLEDIVRDLRDFYENSYFYVIYDSFDDFKKDISLKIERYLMDLTLFLLFSKLLGKDKLHINQFKEEDEILFYKKFIESTEWLNNKKFKVKDLVCNESIVLKLFNDVIDEKSKKYRYYLDILTTDGYLICDCLYTKLYKEKYKGILCIKDNFQIVLS